MCSIRKYWATTREDEAATCALILYGDVQKLAFHQLSAQWSGMTKYISFQNNFYETKYRHSTSSCYCV